MNSTSTRTALIDAQTLHDMLGDRRLVVVDVRHDLARPDAGREAYMQGHIPGAHFLHLDRDLSGPQRDGGGRFRGRHPLPARDDFARRLASLGVRTDSLLVAYDEAEGMFAARLWWLARWLGHAQVAVLDGGLDAWRNAGYALSREVPSPAPAAPLPAGDPALHVIEADALERELRSGRYVVVDARAPERYRGEIEPIDSKAGHIPGARNRFYKRNLGADGRFAPPEELRKEFLALLGTRDARTVVHQCGSGVTACHNVLAMHVAGLGDAVLYPGSWSEWSSDPGRPTATGDEAKTP